MRLERSYLKLAALALGIVALAAVAGVLTAKQGGMAASASRSSYSTAPAGAGGFYELLCRTEAVPPLQLRSLEDLPSLQGVLVIVGPLEKPLTQEEAGRVLTWVHAGNGLLYLVGAEEPGRAPCALEDVLAGPRDQPRRPPLAGVFGEVQPAVLNGSVPAFRGAPTILVEVPTRPRDGLYLRGTALYNTPAGAEVAWAPRGWGQVISCLSSTPIQNRGIGEGHNLDFLLCAIKVLRPAGGRIVFDEFHHGYVRPKSLLSLLSLEGTLIAALQLGLCGLLYVVLQGRRMGPPVEPRAAQQATAHRYLEAAGQLYRQHCTPAEVVTAYGTFVARALRRPGKTRPAAVAPEARTAASLRDDADEVAALLEAVARRGGSRVGPAEATALVSKLGELARNVRPERASGTVRPFTQERFHAPGSAADR